MRSSRAPEEIKKELGDVLLHIVFYSTIGEEQGTFDLCDVTNALCDKLIYRHPHVYGEAVAASAGAVVERWEELKQQEKGGNKTVPLGCPCLPTHPHQGLPHTGQGTWCGLRLGATRGCLDEGRRGAS